MKLYAIVEGRHIKKFAATEQMLIYETRERATYALTIMDDAEGFGILEVEVSLSAAQQKLLKEPTND